MPEPRSVGWFGVGFLVGAVLMFLALVKFVSDNYEPRRYDR